MMTPAVTTIMRGDDAYINKNKQPQNHFNTQTALSKLLLFLQTKIIFACCKYIILYSTISSQTKLLSDTKAKTIKYATAVSL